MFKFKHPFTCLVAGPTQSGKTHFIFELINNLSALVEPTPTKIIWCFGEYQPKLDELPKNVIKSYGLSALDEIDPADTNLVIIDDLMDEAGNSKEVSKLFTKGSHHRNLSVILVVQNLFHQGKVMRTISLNCHYIILFKNDRDKRQITYLASQSFPGKLDFLEKAFKMATSKPHGYLLLDFNPKRFDERQVWSDILPSEDGPAFYVPV